MRRCSSVLLLAPVLALVDLAAAQMLDLDGVAAAPEPPPLGLGTYAADLSRRLVQEMKDIAAGAEQVPAAAQTVALASIKLRDLGIRLLEQGDMAGPAGSVTVLAGIRLARGRVEIDGLLGRAATDDLEPALAALRLYVDAGNAWRTEPDPDDPAALDAALAAHLEPLAEAVRLLVPGETVNHWVTTAEVIPDADADLTASPAIDALLGRLVGTADTTELNGAGRDALARTVVFLERGASFEEFRPQVREYAVLLAEALELAADIEAAPWLSDEQRGKCRDIIAAAIVQFAERPSRMLGVQRLHKLAESRGIVRRITALGETTRAAAPGRSRTAEPRLDMEPVTRAFGAVVTAASEPDDAPQVDRLASILDRMIAYRELQTPALTRELRDAWRRLHDGYARTEQAILEALPELTANPGAMADPALASLVADHRQYLDDLQRLQSLPEWMERVRQAAPRASATFAGRLRKTVGDLAAPARRQDAVRRIDRLETQMRTYFPLPFEQRLIDGERAAIIATGGLHEQLAVEIDRQRRVWAGAWGGDDPAGDGGEATRRMETLLRLTRIMADAAPLLEAETDLITLDRWAAWELDPATIDRRGADLRNRLKLASKAAVDGDDGGLAEQVARIRAGETALISALLARLEAPLAGLPPGPLSIMGQSINGPVPDAWMLPYRRRLADLCRYTMEMDYARSTGRAQLADDLESWIDDGAAAIMKETTP